MELAGVKRNKDVSIGLEEWTREQYRCLIQHYNGLGRADYFFTTTARQREDTYEFIIWEGDLLVADGYGYEGIGAVYSAALDALELLEELYVYEITIPDVNLFLRSDVEYWDATSRQDAIEKHLGEWPDDAYLIESVREFPCQKCEKSIAIGNISDAEEGEARCLKCFWEDGEEEISA